MNGAASEDGFLDPIEALKVALDRHHPNIAQACSFQAEAVVIIDMLMSIRDDVRVFAIDTGRFHEETYEVAENIRQRYGDIITWYFPDKKAVEQMVSEKGMYSFRNSAGEPR